MAVSNVVANREDHVFVVDLRGIDLTDRERRGIEKAVREAAVGAVARLDMAPPELTRVGGTGRALTPGASQPGVDPDRHDVRLAWPLTWHGQMEPQGIIIRRPPTPVEEA